MQEATLWAAPCSPVKGAGVSDARAVRRMAAAANATDPRPALEFVAPSLRW